MLYDPKWEKKTKADPLTLGSLIAWLECQNPETSYNWEDCGGRCLIGLYYIAVFGARIFYESSRPQLSAVFTDTRMYHRVAGAFPHTFGAALERARAELAPQ